MEILQFSKYQIIVLIMIKIDCSIGQVRKLNSPMTCAIKSTVVNIGIVKSAIECTCRCQMISKGKCTQMSFNTDMECTIFSTDQSPSISPWSVPVQPAWTLYSIDIRGTLTGDSLIPHQGVRVRVMVFNNTLIYISVLVVEEIGENHRPVASHRQN